MFRWRLGHLTKGGVAAITPQYGIRIVYFITDIAGNIAGQEDGFTRLSELLFVI